MRYLVVLSFALLAFAGAAAWVVEAEPDWYLRSDTRSSTSRSSVPTRTSGTSIRRWSPP